MAISMNRMNRIVSCLRVCVDYVFCLCLLEMLLSQAIGLFGNPIPMLQSPTAFSARWKLRGMCMQSAPVRLGSRCVVCARSNGSNDVYGKSLSMLDQSCSTLDGSSFPAAFRSVPILWAPLESL